VILSFSNTSRINLRIPLLLNSPSISLVFFSLSYLKASIDPYKSEVEIAAVFTTDVLSFTLNAIKRAFETILRMVVLPLHTGPTKTIALDLRKRSKTFTQFLN
jgi:hypothetical protein